MPKRIVKSKVVRASAQRAAELEEVFGKVTNFVVITIAGTQYEVPAHQSVMRAMQFIDLPLIYERICWNGGCMGCIMSYYIKEKGVKKPPLKKALACTLEAQEGMVIEELPGSVKTA